MAEEKVDFPDAGSSEMLCALPCAVYLEPSTPYLSSDFFFDGILFPVAAVSEGNDFTQ